jgi:hypothetical protein
MTRKQARLRFGQTFFPIAVHLRLIGADNTLSISVIGSRGISIIDSKGIRVVNGRGISVVHGRRVGIVGSKGISVVDSKGGSVELICLEPPSLAVQAASQRPRICGIVTVFPKLTKKELQKSSLV